jgi:predicted lysophospholipase L1 biosynthesis ABC-type transport system permease subunit
MIFMFVTTIAALVYTSHSLLVTKALSGAVKGPDLIGNILMGIVALFLVVAALVISWEGYKAFRRMREMKAAAATAKA